MATWLWLLLSISGTSAVWSEERVGRRALQVHLSPERVRPFSVVSYPLHCRPSAPRMLTWHITGCVGLAHSNSRRPRLRRLQRCGRWTSMGTTTT
jgi:hypothetical protein